MKQTTISGSIWPYTSYSFQHILENKMEKTLQP